MRRCILHVGSPKTATTSIQFMLKKNRRRFLKHGILVPESGQDSTGSHRALAYQLAGLPVRPEEEGADTEFVREIANSPADTILISSEWLWPILRSKADAQRVIGKLNSLGLAVTVLLYVRNQTQYLNSSYAQGVKSFRQGREFAAVVRRAILGSHKFAYSHWIEFAETHGVTALARPFSEALRRSGIAQDFLKTVGVSSADGFDSSFALNQATGPFAVAVARLLLKRIGGPRSLTLLQANRCQGALRQELESQGIDDQRYCGLTNKLAADIEEALSLDNARFARFAWGTSWCEHFSSDMGRGFEPNDYSIVGLPADRRALFDTVVARLEPKVDAIVEDEALGIAADWNRRRRLRPARRAADREAAAGLDRVTE